MPDNNEDIKPWMQQKGEQSKSFYYFTQYRDLGPARIIEKVIDKISQHITKCQENKEYPPEKIPKIPTMDALIKLSSRWKWVDRCRQWDEELDRVARTEQEKAVKEMVERHANESKSLQEAVISIKDSEEFKKLKPTQQAWVLNTTTHSYHKLAGLERISRGEPNEIQQEEEEKRDAPTEIEDLFRYAEGGNEEDDSS